MRKTKLVPIAPKGDGDTSRDLGKVFLLTEMPASQAEKWAMRAFLALSHANVDVPKEVAQLGMIGVAMVGMRAFTRASWSDIEPLMDEMMGCVQICPTPGETAIVRPLIETDIEEVETRFRLRKEAIELHVGFTIADAGWLFQMQGSATGD